MHSVPRPGLEAHAVAGHHERGVGRRPGACSTNARGTKYLLAVAGTDARAAVTKLEEESLAALDPVALEAAQHIIDRDAAENDGPACGRRFAGHPARCPGCGLRIG
jgi:hypothetical protein